LIKASELKWNSKLRFKGLKTWFCECIADRSDCGCGPQHSQDLKPASVSRSYGPQPISYGPQ